MLWFSRCYLYCKCFATQDNEGQTGPFLDELRVQTEQERMQFIQEITDKFDGQL